uniref:Uncharacterized protein n=1 Tax=Strigamia maritima TaxID=126957 RepID=T1ITW4_STRMM
MNKKDWIAHSMRILTLGCVTEMEQVVDALISISDVDSSNEENYDMLSLVHAAVHSFSVVDIRLNVFHRLNTPIKPCINKSEFRNCRKVCIQEQIQKAKLCKLPVLANFIDNLAPCKSSTLAKKSLKSYVDILSNLTKSCLCNRICMETHYVLNLYGQLLPFDQPFLFAFTMLTNIAEHIIEVEHYSLMALCADIGNSFGLALGMCVLSFLRYFNLLILWLQSRLTSNV